MTIRRLIDWDPTPLEVAEAFSELDAVQQAEVFVYLADISERWLAERDPNILTAPGGQWFQCGREIAASHYRGLEVLAGFVEGADLQTVGEAELEVEVARLRSVIAQFADGVNGRCPWCTVLLTEEHARHKSDCAAFNEDGSVK